MIWSITETITILDLRRNFIKNNQQIKHNLSLLLPISIKVEVNSERNNSQEIPLMIFILDRQQDIAW